MKPADILLALIVVLIWGFNFVVIKLGLQGLPPILFTALRFACAALPLVFFIRRPAVPLHLLAGYAAFQFAVQFTLLFSGMKIGFPPGLASLVIQLQAFFTIGLAVAVLGERPRWPQVAGALIAFTGMGLVAAHLEARATFLGFLMVVAAGFSWGVGNIFTKRIGKVDALALVVWGSLLATPPLVLASLAIEGPDVISGALQRIDWLSAGAVMFQAYPTTILGFGIWSMLMRKYPAATVAPFTLLVPVAGMLSAALVLGEPLQWWKIAAGLLVLTGLALNQFGGRVLSALAAAK
ncbi:EamA family transporter [Noviherbaspirillum denitrificans]|uniref:Acetylserine transporter n=1 Tax=Noviherbaspirillum denitrificans TaxID=1968433 RepID=A0A254TCT7_9BURK|nr:EamA family transporter [Noviherbaspirillum denitrificans]OWW20451.1 acetylserine transporter [Noviherbaspirillum denitrificans]